MKQVAAVVKVGRALDTVRTPAGGQAPPRPLAVGGN